MEPNIVLLCAFMYSMSAAVTCDKQPSIQFSRELIELVRASQVGVKGRLAWGLLRPPIGVRSSLDSGQPAQWRLVPAIWCFPVVARQLPPANWMYKVARRATRPSKEMPESNTMEEKPALFPDRARTIAITRAEMAATVASKKE